MRYWENEEKHEKDLDTPDVKPAFFDEVLVFGDERLLGRQSAVFEFSVEFGQLVLKDVEFLVSTPNLPMLRNRVFLTAVHSVNGNVQDAKRAG